MRGREKYSITSMCVVSFADYGIHAAVLIYKQLKQVGGCNGCEMHKVLHESTIAISHV